MARGQGKAITRQAHWPDSQIVAFYHLNSTANTPQAHANRYIEPMSQ
jgi:hypothetical protein